MGILKTCAELSTPALNPLLKEGLSGEITNGLVEEIHKRWITASMLFPEGLTYKGYTLLSPLQEVKEITKVATGKINVDAAITDTRAVSYDLDLRGTPIPVIINVPFFSDISLYRSSNTTYRAATVVTDKSISETPTGIFCRFDGDKFRAERIYYNIRLNGVPTPGKVVVANFERRKIKPTKKWVHTPVIAYVMGSSIGNGLINTIKRYTGVTVVTGKQEEISTKYYDVYSVAGFSINGDIAVGVPKEETNEFVVDCVVGALSMVYDSECRVSSDSINTMYAWREMIGELVYKELYKDRGGRMRAMTNGFSTYDNLISESDIEVLRMEFPEDFISQIVNDGFYGVMMTLIESYTRLTQQAEATMPSMFQKRFVLMHYWLSVYTIGINMFRWSVTQKAASKPLTVPAVRKFIMAQKLRRAGFKIHTNNNNIVTPYSYGGDSIILGRTMHIKLQHAAAGAQGNSRGRRAGSGDANKIHPSHCAVANVLYVTAPNPNGCGTLNLFSQYNEEDMSIICPAPAVKQVQVLADALAAKGRARLDNVDYEPDVDYETEQDPEAMDEPPDEDGGESEFDNDTD
jgi:hypothetical protein